MTGPRAAITAALGVVALGLALATVVAFARPHAVAAAADGRHPLAVETRRIAALDLAAPGRLRNGALEFLGGLVLSSRDPGFGGLSGVRTWNRGRDLLAIGDEGIWFAAHLDTDAAGTPLGLSDAAIAPLLDEKGVRFRSKWSRDAESLDLRPVAGGWEARVGFEGRHRVVAYRSASADPHALLGARGDMLELPADVGRLRQSTGLEAIAGDEAGRRLVLIAEESLRGGGEPRPGWILGPGRVERFRVDSGGFSPTDAAFLPSGDLLVLERRLSLLGAFQARLVRIAAGDLAEGRTTSGETLWESRFGDAIDNMEALAVDRAPDGSTILTLLSDDNFFWLQRTLLLRFRLVEPAAKSPPG